MGEDEAACRACGGVSFGVCGEEEERQVEGWCVVWANTRRSPPLFGFLPPGGFHFLPDAFRGTLDHGGGKEGWVEDEEVDGKHREEGAVRSEE